LLIVAFIESNKASEESKRASEERALANSAIKQSEFDKSLAEASIVRARSQTQLADSAREQANAAETSAEAARITAFAAKSEAVKAKNEAILLQERSNQLSDEVETKVEELERSQIIEEFLNILKEVRDKSDNANVAQTNSSTPEQRHEAAKIATAGYREFQKTSDVKYIDIVQVDTMRSELDKAQKKLFSSMNFAFQNVNTSSPLFVVGNGVIIDKNIKVTNDQGNGEFLIGANDENPTVYKVKINTGNVSSVDVISHISNLQEKIHGIRQLSYSGNSESFLVSHLPIEQGKRNMSKYDSEGILTFSQTMPTAIKVIYPFNDADFMVVDQNANIYHMKDMGDRAYDTVRVYSSNDHLRAIDNHNERGQIFLEKGNKEIIRLSISQDGKISETGSLDLENEFSTQITVIKYIPGREWLVVGNRNGEFYVFNALSGNFIYKDLLQHAGSINCFELSGDERTLVSGGRDKVINIWNLDELETYVGKGSNGENLYQPAKFREIEAIRDISFVGDKYIIVVTSSEGFTGNINSGRVSLLPLDFDIMYDKLSNLVD
jgi:WD40 repeat protein